MSATKLSQFTSICRKIVAVGRNYKDHALELGNAVPTKPILFMKPASSFIVHGQDIEIPVGCSEIHHEIELGIVIGKTARKVDEAESMAHIGGYVLALDMTARDFQNEAKAKGHPWTMAKCFDTSCPVGEFLPPSAIRDPHNVQLECQVNGELRQQGNTKDMIFSVPYLISYISRYLTLEEGDVILTGTPSGVGPVKSKDLIQGQIPGLTKIEFNVK